MHVGNDRRECEYFEDVDKILGGRPDCHPARTMSSSSTDDSSCHSPQSTCTSSKKHKAGLATGTPSKPSKQDKMCHEERKQSSAEKKRAGDGRHEDFMSFLKATEDRRMKEEAERQSKLETMHEEKMTIMKNFIDVLKVFRDK